MQPCSSAGENLSSATSIHRFALHTGHISLFVPSNTYLSLTHFAARSFEQQRGGATSIIRDGIECLGSRFEPLVVGFEPFLSVSLPWWFDTSKYPRVSQKLFFIGTAYFKYAPRHNLAINEEENSIVILHYLEMCFTEATRFQIRLYEMNTLHSLKYFYF